MSEEQVAFGVAGGIAAGWALLLVGLLAQPFSVAHAAGKKGRTGVFWFLLAAVYSWGIVPSVLGALGFVSAAFAGQGNPTMESAALALMPLLVAWIVSFLPSLFVRMASDVSVRSWKSPRRIMRAGA